MPDIVEASDGADVFVFVLPHQFIGKICDQLNNKLKPSTIGISLIKVMFESPMNAKSRMGRKNNFLTAVDLFISFRCLFHYNLVYFPFSLPDNFFDPLTTSLQFFGFNPCSSHSSHWA